MLTTQGLFWGAQDGPDFLLPSTLRGLSLHLSSLLTRNTNPHLGSLSPVLMGLQTMKAAGCLTLSLLLLSGGPFSSYTEMCRAEAQVKARAQMFVRTPVLELDCPPLSLLGGNSYTELLVE